VICIFFANRKKTGNCLSDLSVEFATTLCIFSPVKPLIKEIQKLLTPPPQISVFRHQLRRGVRVKLSDLEKNASKPTNESAMLSA